MTLEVRQLEVLLAVERAGSLSGAAVVLGTDQPHVSRTLRRIEEQLGFPVFERGRAGARPTAAGAAVLDRARTAVAALDLLRQPAAQRGLRVLCHEVPTATLARVLRADRSVPDVRLGDAPPATAYQQLVAGTADVVVTARLPHVQRPCAGAVTEVAVGTVPTVVCLPATHRLAAGDHIELADLAGDSWIVDEDPIVERALLAECRAVGGFVPRIRYRASTFNGAYSYFRHGLAVRLGAPGPERDAFVTRPYRGGGPTTVLVAFAATAAARARAAPVLAAARTLVDDGGRGAEGGRGDKVCDHDQEVRPDAT